MKLCTPTQPQSQHGEPSWGPAQPNTLPHLLRELPHRSYFLIVLLIWFCYIYIRRRYSLNSYFPSWGKSNFYSFFCFTNKNNTYTPVKIYTMTGEKQSNHFLPLFYTFISEYILVFIIYVFKFKTRIRYIALYMLYPFTSISLNTSLNDLL